VVCAIIALAVLVMSAVLVFLTVDLVVVVVECIYELYVFGHSVAEAVVS